MRRKSSKSQTQERNKVHPLPHAALLELSEWGPPVLATVDILNQSLIQMQIAFREILSVISRQNDEIHSHIVMWGKFKICSCQIGHLFTDIEFLDSLQNEPRLRQDLFHQLFISIFQVEVNFRSFS